MSKFASSTTSNHRFDAFSSLSSSVFGMDMSKIEDGVTNGRPIWETLEMTEQEYWQKFKPKPLWEVEGLTREEWLEKHKVKVIVQPEPEQTRPPSPDPDSQPEQNPPSLVQQIVDKIEPKKKKKPIKKI